MSSTDKIRFVDQYSATPGEGPFDKARRAAHVIGRAFETGRDGEQRRLRGPEGQILCISAALGRSKDGLTTHFHADQAPQTFQGFQIASETVDGKNVIQTHGVVSIKVEGAELAGIGASVYVSGIDSFSTVPEVHSARMGRIIGLGEREGWARVAFWPTGDDPPPVHDGRLRETF